jgi:hypothetical protein
MAAAAPPTLERPPASPEVTGQQDEQGPSAQFIQQGQGPGGSAAALAEKLLNQVAADLKQTAQALSQSMPNVLPLIQRAAQALSMAMNQVQQSKQQQGGAGQQRQQPEPQSGPEGPAEGAPPPSM